MLATPAAIILWARHVSCQSEQCVAGLWPVTSGEARCDDILANRQGPVAQRQSSRLISDASKVRLLPGLPLVVRGPVVGCPSPAPRYPSARSPTPDEPTVSVSL